MVSVLTQYGVFLAVTKDVKLSVANHFCYIVGGWEIMDIGGYFGLLKAQTRSANNRSNSRGGLEVSTHTFDIGSRVRP